MTINIPVTDGAGTTLSDEIPTYLGKLKITCPNNINRYSDVEITFVGSTINISCIMKIDLDGRTLIIGTPIGTVTGINILVADPEGVTSMDVEFIEWTEEWL